LLTAVNPVLGVVNVEQDAPGSLVEAVAEQLDHSGHHAFERDRAGQVLQPADARLRAQIIATLRSSMQAAKRSAIPSRRSIADSSNIPASEVIWPPSKPICTGLPATAGKPGKIPVPSPMAGANSVGFG
jgi:hypothetical protein